MNPLPQVVTLKKLQVSPDAFSFSDKVLENWYPTAEIGDKKGVFLLVGGSKEGALSGGPAFMKTLGEGETTRTGRRIFPPPTHPPTPGGIGERLTERTPPAGLLEEIITEDIPTYLEPDLKFNGAASGSVARISAQLQGKVRDEFPHASRVSAGTDLSPPSPVQEVPTGPKAAKARNTNRTYKTKAETKRGNYGAVLIALLTIATVVPMVQYWSYVREE